MNESYPVIRFQPNRHKRFAAGHPWVYSNEIVMDTAAKALLPGALVQFQGSHGQPLGIGGFHPHNLICGRVLSRTITAITPEWFADQLRRALALRERLFSKPYYRLCHAEADGLSGLIIDRYGDHLIVQLNSAVMDCHSTAIITALQNLLSPQSIILRNDSSARLLEGLPQAVTVAYGAMPERMIVQENGLKFFADPATGQKTGWFYDQRHNRALVAQFCRDAHVLDVFCHTGGFALNAAASGAAHIVGIDSSEHALACAKAAAEQNSYNDKINWRKSDAFDLLTEYTQSGEQFDVVITDPPAFIKSRKDIAAGTRGYRKLVRLAAPLVKPGGFFFIASCSHHLTLESLGEQIASGLQDNGRTGQILHTVFAAPDHPLHPHLPESAYLKGQFLRLF